MLLSIIQYSNMIHFLVFIHVHTEQNYCVKLVDIHWYYFWLFCLNSGSKPISACLKSNDCFYPFNSLL